MCLDWLLKYKCENSIQVGNNYITLPGEVFEDITESGSYAV